MTSLDLFLQVYIWGILAMFALQVVMLRYSHDKDLHRALHSGCSPYLKVAVMSFIWWVFCFALIANIIKRIVKR